MILDVIDRKLLNLVQTDFPLTAEPYSDLGQRLGISTHEVIGDIVQLKKKGIIRLIGPVINYKSLGYKSTLVAMKVAKAKLEKVERVIAGHSGVSHGYEREHDFNVWFTLAMPPVVNIDTELEKLAHSTGAESLISLPVIKMFKIGAYFDMDDSGQSVPAVYQNGVPAKHVELSRSEKLIINELQQDLPLIPAPFNIMAERANVNVADFLAICRSLQQRGVIRRFSASINHRHAGFTANVMACWAVPPDKIDFLGQKLASFKEVSHCYERKTSSQWRYNLFAMIHCRSRDECQEIADKLSQEAGLEDYILLYSTREFKKTRVKYLV